MPYKTSSGKWKWGNIERKTKGELVKTVYGIWKKNGSPGSFSAFWHGRHVKESSEETHKFFKVKINGKEIGKYGLSFYDDIKAVGLGSFEIYPEYRDKGYGTKVINDMVNKYKNDYNLIYCFVDADNKDAIRFYKKIGKVSPEITTRQKVGDYEWVNTNGQHFVELYRKESKMDESSEGYERPWTLDEIKTNLPDLYDELKNDPIHRWRAETGIELIHKGPSREELDRIWKNWQLMGAEMKAKSEQKSHELFGMSNEEHYRKLIGEGKSKKLTFSQFLKENPI